MPWKLEQHQGSCGVWTRGCVSEKHPKVHTEMEIWSLCRDSGLVSVLPSLQQGIPTGWALSPPALGSLLSWEQHTGVAVARTLLPQSHQGRVIPPSSCRHKVTQVSFHTCQVLTLLLGLERPPVLAGSRANQAQGTWPGGARDRDRGPARIFPWWLSDCDKLKNKTKRRQAVSQPT